jgi:hypothetical protein
MEVAGRPRLPENIRKLIVQMAQENPTCGQARVAAELSVKLGIHVSPRTVRAYWPPEPERRAHRRISSQNWRTFVRNHAQSIVACDFLVVVTARFRTLYVFRLMEVGTRRIVHCNVTAHPTAAGENSLVLICTRLISTIGSYSTITAVPSGNDLYVKDEQMVCLADGKLQSWTELLRSTGNRTSCGAHTQGILVSISSNLPSATPLRFSYSSKANLCPSAQAFGLNRPYALNNCEN